MSTRSVAALAAAVVVATLGCQQYHEVAENQSEIDRPMALGPSARQPAHEMDTSLPPVGPDLVSDLTHEAVAWGTAEPEIIDTRNFSPQIVREVNKRAPRDVEEMLPEESPGFDGHEDRDRVGGREKFEERERFEEREAREHRDEGEESDFNRRFDPGTPNHLPVGQIQPQLRATVTENFPGIDQTGWVPPDCSFAVGPQYIVTTVNQDIAFLTKDGNLFFQQGLGSAGNPGFFEPEGAGNFTFDPKCFYDQYAQRFVVVTPEVYGSTEAWISIAVSDDSNPIGLWYKYRTDAVIQVGSNTFWWDYPGFGYDQDGYYVTGNLFGLNNGGWGGVGYRVFHKADMLTGSPVTYSTLRDPNAGSVQIAHCFGDPPAPFFVSLQSGSSLRIQAITNPLTNPQLATTIVTVPSFSGPGEAPAAGGNSVNLIDNRIFNVQWRDGNLYATHGISAGGKNVARWYHMDTASWPNGGSVSLVESGNIDPGGSLHSFFPAIYSNKLHEVGMVVGTSSANDRIAVAVTGRLPTDPPGTMGPLTQVMLSTVDTGGRWGDYYDMATDPNDDRTFWVMGEYGASNGWNTWISSFQLSSVTGPYAMPDQIDFAVSEEPVNVDVLANDGHTEELPIHIESFDSTSAHGGTISLAEGVGPGGRDELSYTPPAGYAGSDSFDYTIADSSGETADATVTAQVYDASTMHDPATPPLPTSGLNVAYYDVSSPSSMPDFDSMTPFLTDHVTQINYTATGGDFATSGRQDNVGAVFEGYVNVEQLGAYRFYTTSDDGSLLYIDGELVVNNDGLHGMAEQWGVVALRPGLHDFRVDYFEAGGSAGLFVEYEGPGLTRQVIPASAFRRDNGCPPDLMPPFGQIDFFDVQVFLAMFSSQNPLADINYDGKFDFYDVQIYLQLVAEGCP